MSIEQMRAEIIKVYPGGDWYNKCMAMPDAQVAAVYQRFLNNNQLVKEKK